MGPKRKLHAHLNTMRASRSLNASLTNEPETLSNDEQEGMEVDDNDPMEPLKFRDRISINDMADLFELCKTKCPIKYLSVLVYTTLRSFGVSWDNCNAFLQNIGEFLNNTVPFSYVYEA